VRIDSELVCGWLYENLKLPENTPKNAKKINNIVKTRRMLQSKSNLINPVATGGFGGLTPPKQRSKPVQTEIRNTIN